MKETKYISEVEYLTFKQDLRSVLIKTIVGFLIGVFIAFSVEDCTLIERIAYIPIFACFPYAWTAMPFYAGGLISLFFKFVLCFAFGWLITPVVLLYNFIQMKRYENHVDYHIKQEELEKQASIQRENHNFDRVIEAITLNSFGNKDADWDSLNARYKKLLKHITVLLNEFSETMSTIDTLTNQETETSSLKASLLTVTSTFNHHYNEIQRLNEKIKDENPDYSKSQYIIDEIGEHYTTMQQLQHKLMKETQEFLASQHNTQTAASQNTDALDEGLFQGCTDRESLNKRYKNLMKIYHPDNSDGDLSMTQKIQATYEKLLKELS